jgi:prepilin-type N-terminal cleavage/methylation domain-containing protein
MIRRRPPGAPRSLRDAGFTLTELLVVITLTGIVGSITVAAVTTGLRKQSQVQDRNDALAQARTALQRVDRDIRSSDPLEAAQANQIVVQESQATETRTMTYSVIPAAGSTSQLVVDESDVSSSGVALTSPPRRVVLSNLVNTSTNPVFNFSPSSTYTASSTGTVNTATCAVSGTTPVAYDPTCVGTVTVNLAVEPATINQPIYISDNGTDLRNPA